MNDQNSQFENDSYRSGSGYNDYGYVFSDGNGFAPQPPRTPRKRGVATVLIIALLCVCLSFGAGFSGVMYAKHLFAEGENGESGKGNETFDPSGVLNEDPESVLAKAEPNSSIYGSAGEDAFAASGVVRMVQDAVVVIDTLYPSAMGYSQSGTGSGVVISADGYILTCNHVVEDAHVIKVTLNSGSIYDATLVGNDSASDLAVIKITPNAEEPLTYVEQGCSGDLVVAETVIAIGNPLGMGLTVSEGIVSATERQITMSDGTEMTLIQTDAAINSGNSGGGLFNLDGQLIGIVNAKYSASGVEGLAFAIPIDSAYPVETQLIQYGYVRGVVDHGLTLLDVNESNLWQAFYQYKLREVGVYIYSSEYNENLKTWDRIVSVDGEKIETLKQFEEIIKLHEVGDQVSISVIRNGKTITDTLELVEYIPDRLKDQAD